MARKLKLIDFEMLITHFKNVLEFKTHSLDTFHTNRYLIYE